MSCDDKIGSYKKFLETYITLNEDCQKAYARGYKEANEALVNFLRNSKNSPTLAKDLLKGSEFFLKNVEGKD